MSSLTNVCNQNTIMTERCPLTNNGELRKFNCDYTDEYETKQFYCITNYDINNKNIDPNIDLKDRYERLLTNPKYPDIPIVVNLTYDKIGKDVKYALTDKKGDSCLKIASPSGTIDKSIVFNLSTNISQSKKCDHTVKEIDGQNKILCDDTIGDQITYNDMTISGNFIKVSYSDTDTFIKGGDVDPIVERCLSKAGFRKGQTQ